jgi:deoxyribodipyrimidine photolyase-related protein
MKNLLFILSDQLSRSLSRLKACSLEDTFVFMAEVQEQATYAAHHKKKIAFVFSAMRHFARELKAAAGALITLTRLRRLDRL